jgi:hypothetical protein
MPGPADRAEPSGSPTCRYVLVVPRDAPDTLAYLQESFRTLADIEVVMERRRRDAPQSSRELDRRVVGRERLPLAFGCTLIRVQGRGPCHSRSSSTTR